jgi:hypothetical protein
MAKPSELLEEAAKCRDLAKRAARFAASLLCDADRARLLGRAKRLEEQAAELERQAAALMPPLTLSVGLAVKLLHESDEHHYLCPICGHWVDELDLEEVLQHVDPDHQASAKN